MTTALLTKEQVESLTYKECKAALKLLNKTYRMDTPWAQLTKEERALTDEIGNTLLWLEDRIQRFDDPRIFSMDPTATALPVVQPKEPKPQSNGPKARPYRIGDKIYKDVHEASMKTGIKVNTLRTYVGRNPDKYGYLDHVPSLDVIDDNTSTTN